MFAAARGSSGSIIGAKGAVAARLPIAWVASVITQAVTPSWVAAGRVTGTDSRHGSPAAGRRGAEARPGGGARGAGGAGGWVRARVGRLPWQRGDGVPDREVQVEARLEEADGVGVRWCPQHA